MKRISSILKKKEGVIRFEGTKKNRVTVTYDDRRTSKKEIVEALVKGGVTVPGQSAPPSKEPMSYR